MLEVLKKQAPGKKSMPAKKGMPAKKAKKPMKKAGY